VSRRASNGSSLPREHARDRALDIQCEVGYKYLGVPKYVVQAASLVLTFASGVRGEDWLRTNDLQQGYPWNDRSHFQFRTI
jgi:hypothetical protein